MELVQIENILRYHSQEGFRNDLKMIFGRISDLKERQTEISAINYKVAIPNNHNNVSSVEIYVVRNATISEMEMEARELERFINKLDESIDGLPENERTVLKARYFTKDGSVTPFENMAYDIHYSREWCTKLNQKALEDINTALSGYKILWEALK